MTDEQMYEVPGSRLRELRDAEAENKQLRADLEEWKGADLEARTPAYKLERLVAENALLREALEPFAEIADRIDKFPYGGPPSPLLAVQDECDHARKVLRGDKS